MIYPLQVILQAETYIYVLSQLKDDEKYLLISNNFAGDYNRLLGLAKQVKTPIDVSWPEPINLNELTANYSDIINYVQQIVVCLTSETINDI